MKRKTFAYPLLDGNTYIFSERNQEDVDYSLLQDKVRKSKVDWAVQNLRKIDEDLCNGIIMQQVNMVYDAQQIMIYIASNPEEIIKLVYSSFKLKNTKDYEEFKKLIDLPMGKKLLEMINDIEKTEELPDKECAEALGITVKKLIGWNKTQPEVYRWLKQNVKKNTEPDLAEK